MLKSGIYEQIINNEIEQELREIPEERKNISQIDKVESSKIISSYTSDLLQKRLDDLYDEDSKNALRNQINFANRIIVELSDENDTSNLITDDGNQLLGFMEENDPKLIIGKKAKDLLRPETSIAHSSLFTGKDREPQMLSELKKEIESSSAIDMLVSFIKWSGLRQLINELDEFTRRGGKLRVICTPYMGATDLKAIEELAKLSNTEVKITYDTKGSRLHAKAYVFYRDTGFSTAYIGSSNMSNAALTSGLEWNLKITMSDMPNVMKKINATFESYWNDSEFELYDATQSVRLSQALKQEKYVGEGAERKYVFDIHPYYYQQEILDKLQVERIEYQSRKNLVVAATGCGKTVIAAFDYLRYRKLNPNRSNRLLFVAHREEILEQSIETFREVLKDPNFGGIFDGNYQPESLDYVFATIQTINSRRLDQLLDANYYDYIVVDEFHHAAAESYQRLLNYFQPDILLGLTATPERRDGLDILQYFDGRIAAEIRLPEAIDRKLLCPFQYFGISDTVDLSDVKWTRRGYEISALNSLFVEDSFSANRRADNVIRNVEKYVTSIDDMKALGFCVSKEHARFMSNFFNQHNISSIELDSSSTRKERLTAKTKLETGIVKVIFVVDLYNEGIDIKSVNTVLFLRPTESLTIFLQQLGRGLRLDDEKECLTVLDFVGQANKKYNYEEKFAALLSNTKNTVQYEIQNGFVSAPKGCYITLEKKAQEYVLSNIKSSIEKKEGLILKAKYFEEDTGKILNLENFLNEYHLDPRDIYKKEISFSRLCVLGDAISDFNEDIEERITKALPKLASIDSKPLLNFMVNVLSTLDTFNYSDLTLVEKIMLRMFYVSIWENKIDFEDEKIRKKNIEKLFNSPVMKNEIEMLFRYSLNHLNTISSEVGFNFENPITLHSTYTRNQLLAGLEYKNYQNLREGVVWIPEKKLDVLLITLNKSEKDYSPNTMYDDYSLTSKLFHWQSQNKTKDTSDTGQRYIHHKDLGTNVLLCVRESKKDKWGNFAPYTVLGLVDFQSYSGSAPMTVIWKMRNEIPARFLRKTNQYISE